MSDFRQSEEELFQHCLELPSEEREAFLQSSCGGDADLLNRVRILVKSHEKSGGFFDSLIDADSAAIAGRLERIAPSEESTGDQIGRYKLLEQLGEGAWGTVWMARQTEGIQRQVALKILKLGMDTKDFLARFEAERQMLAMMNHPHIARVIDAGATDYGRPYMVMELVKGIPLTEYADRHNLTVEERVRLFIKVCDALQHAHQKGIIHRDLKPSNILVSVEGDKVIPKVIDFGVAKSNQFRLTDKTLFTSIHTFIGTPVYSSPEQLEFSGMDVDPRSDVYSLGVLLYELLCGKTPFEFDQLSQESMEAFRTLVREVDPPKPSQRFFVLSEEDKSSIAAHRKVADSKVELLLTGDLDWIIMKCLEKNRSRRYESAGLLAKDLEAYLEDMPVSAAAPSPIYRIRKFIKRKRPAYAIWLEVSLVMVALLALAVFLIPRPSSPEAAYPGLNYEATAKSIAVLPLENLSPDPDMVFYAKSFHKELTTYLAKIREFDVTGWASAGKFRGSEKDFTAVGGELGVSFILAGSFKREDADLFVDIALIDAETGKHLWAQKYEQFQDDPYGIQTSITMDTAKQLGVLLSPREIESIQFRPTRSQPAYDLLTKSPQYYDYKRQAGLLEEAVAIDPDFYIAWKSLARIRIEEWKTVRYRNDPELLDAALKALSEVERTAPEHLFLEAKAEFAFERFNDTESAIRYWLAAIEVEPGYGAAKYALGRDYLRLGRLAEAQHWLEASNASDPYRYITGYRLGRLYPLIGMWEEARAVIERELQLPQENAWWGDFHRYRLAILDFIQTGDLDVFLESLNAIPMFRSEAEESASLALFSRDYENALEKLDRINPDEFVFGFYSKQNWYDLEMRHLSLLKSLLLFELGKPDQAVVEVKEAVSYLERVIENDPLADPDYQSNLAIGYALLGVGDRIPALVEEIRERCGSTNYQFNFQAKCEAQIGMAYLILSEEEFAIEILERAMKFRSPMFLHREMALWFIFDRLRGHPRFADLLQG